MRFDQLKEYNIRIIFSKYHAENEKERVVPNRI